MAPQIASRFANVLQHFSILEYGLICCDDPLMPLHFPTLGNQVPHRGQAWSRRMFKTLFLMQGWQFQGEIPNLPKAVAIFAPHTSNRDGWYGFLAMCGLGLKATVLGKHSLMRPPFGALFRWLGVLPVKRDTHMGLTEQVVQHIQQQERIWIALAPEGTRHRAEKLKTGFYQIALQAEVPLLAFTVDYQQKTIKYLGSLIPTGHYEKDLECLLSWYKDQFSVPHTDRLSAPFQALTQSSSSEE